MAKILKESLTFGCMKDQVFPIVGIDQYVSSVGSDDDLITLDFTVRDKQVADDLTEWFERGYEWVIDSETSPGEVTSGKFLVFVEMNRRSKSAEQIMEMITDLETLTEIKPSSWKIKIKDETKSATLKEIKSGITLSPHEYRMAHEEPLNEWRQIAGIQTTNTYIDDEDMKAIKRRAGIF